VLSRSLTFALAALLLTAGCDDEPPPAPPRRDAGPSTGTDGAVTDGGPALAGPGVRCVYPAQGAMLSLAPGSSVDAVVLLRDTDDLASVTVNGTDATVDADGLVTWPLEARFGINTLAVRASNAAGGMTEQSCSFLVSGQWQDPAEEIPSAISMRLNPTGVDDEDATDGLDSLNDIFVATLAGGLLQETLDARFTTGGADIKTLSCDGSTRRTRRAPACSRVRSSTAPTRPPRATGRACGRWTATRSTSSGPLTR